MPLEFIPLMIAITNLIGAGLMFYSCFSFIQVAQARRQTQMADFFGILFGLINGGFFLLNGLNWLYWLFLPNPPTELPLIQLVTALNLLFPAVGVLLIGFFLRTLFTGTEERGKALSYVTTVIGAILVFYFLYLNAMEAITIQLNATGYALRYSIGIESIGMNLLGGLFCMGWMSYEIRTAFQFLREEEETVEIKDRIWRLKFLSISALTFPLVILLPLLPDLPIILKLIQQTILIISVPIFAITWTLTWVLRIPQTISNRLHK
ncbi:MAG: hypothetical protein ACFFC7_12100 [Candidatus Hermodarchaeota archaeon]